MKLLICTVACLLAFLSVPDARAERPDIVIILVDDMGYSDIGCFGGEVQTPALDELAAKGVRFTQFYNAGRCCPTRASLLTGLYPHQAGIGHMIGDKGKPGYLGRLNDQSVTIAEVLKTAGYHTTATGKWHVSPFSYNTGKGSHRDTWPLQRGFDRFTGSLAGGGNFYHPKGWMVDNAYVTPHDDFYYTDDVTNATVKFIDEAPRDKPVFTYVAYTAPHWPLHAHEEDIAKYDGVYDKGWDAIRDARYKRMIEMGIIDAAWKLPGRDKRVRAWDVNLSDPMKKWYAAQMAVHAAMIDRVDQGITKILGSLKQRGTLDNTMILFLSDNGASEETPGMPGIKRFAKEGQDTKWWGYRRDVFPTGKADTFHSIGLPWANASNTPFRWYKSENHEGGIATPLVFYYPAGTEDSMQGKLVHSPGHVIDLMATCADLANATYPEQYKDRTVQPMEGISLRSALQGDELKRDAPLFFEHENCAAIREGQWKLVRLRNKPWELYDLQADRTETNDLAKQHPQRVKDLADKWQAWAKRAKVFPKP
jgi:arylsulfatase